MRAFYIALILLIAPPAFGQKNCKCDSNQGLGEVIDCTPIAFDNHAQLFWSFNCDSSWLTFESPARKKVVIYSLGDGLQELTGRLGYIYEQEFNSTFLIRCNVISGCCTPPVYYLYSKSTGLVKSELGRLIFYSNDKKLPFAIGIESYDSLVVHNFDNGKKYFVPLKKGELENAMKETGRIDAENLFEEPEVNGTVVVLKYLYEKLLPPGQKDPVKTITVDLKKYIN